ncbi:MAG: tryptophan synthase subunit beta [Candidatus Omnitrophica bacterium]|nr:tryptophan synthase subunit beta [Candidatus Omnitrophota bacterium]
MLSSVLLLKSKGVTALPAKTVPDKKGYFGSYGGRFVPETLISALDRLTDAYKTVRRDSKFKRELAGYLTDYAGRPTPLYFAGNLTRRYGRARIFLKREDLLHTGAHKINNTLGQALLAQFLGKKKVIAETGAGQHGVATATAARVLNLECDVYMGDEDIRRQALNVYKMQILGARVIPVHSGSKTLKDATNEAIRAWVTHVDTSYYLLGSTVGPHPYPVMVRDFQSVIGVEARKQHREKTGREPDYLVACVGGGSNSMGLFYPFLKTRSKMFGVEAAGSGIHTRRHAATITKGTNGVLHGMKSIVLQDRVGQIQLAHSISAGLDYPSVGPEHAYLSKTGRVEYVAITDKEALVAFRRLTLEEGIMPALEPAHALAYLEKLMPRTKKNETVIVGLSGRGDKDIDTVRHALKL